MANTATVSSLSFEEALMELETIVKGLETGESPLENSISSYERGIQLKIHCENKLRDAQEKIEKISVNPDNSIKMQPLDTQENNG